MEVFIQNPLIWVFCIIFVWRTWPMMHSKCMKGTRVLLANTKGKWLLSNSKDSINMTWNISPTRCEYHQTKFVYRPNEMRIAVCNSCKIDWNQWKQSGTYHRIKQNLVMTLQVSIPSPKGNITTTRSNIKQISLSWNLSAISFCQVT